MLAELARIARDAGVPAPRYELIAELPSVTAAVQELLPGTPPAAVSRQTVMSMVEVNGRLRGLLAGRADPPPASLYLRADGPGFCLHGPMASYDQRTAILLGQIEEAGAELPEHLAGDDLVHFDFDWAIRELNSDQVSAWLRVAAEVGEENDAVPAP